jgi:hypothetical protein
LGLSRLSDLTLSLPSVNAEIEERLYETHPSILPTTTLDREEIVDRHGRLELNLLINHSHIAFPISPVIEGEESNKIESIGFSYNKPWLPPSALKLLNKLKRGPLAGKEFITLIKIVAERATSHFQLEEGKFVAMTFYGQIIEVSDSRVGILKKLQSRRFKEQIFLWKIGSNAFSGRL